MEWIALLLFASVVLVLLAGFPVAFTLAGTALLFAGGGVVAGVFNEALLSGLPNRVFGIMSNETLVAVLRVVFHYERCCVFQHSERLNIFPGWLRAFLSGDTVADYWPRRCGRKNRRSGRGRK